jgi:hypothetical protein
VSLPFWIVAERCEIRFVWRSERSGWCVVAGGASGPVLTLTPSAGRATPTRLQATALDPRALFTGEAVVLAATTTAVLAWACARGQRWVAAEEALG